MNRDELDRALWELLDGELDDGARAALEARLAADPLARERLRQLEAMAGLLSGVERLDPPAELPAAIARAVARRPPGRPPLAAARAWIHELLAPRWRVRLAWACAGLAVGIAVALLHPALRSAATDDVSRYYGAMVRPEAAARPLLELPEGRGRLTFDRAGALLGVSLGGPAAAEASTLEIAGPGLALRSVVERGEGARRVAVSERGVVVEWRGGGSLELAIEVPRSTSRLALRLVAGARQIHAGEVDLGPAGAPPTSVGPGSN